MDQGRMAVCFDPNGAAFDVWEPNKSHGADADSMLHGATSWFETMTTDLARGSKFYAGLFGWTPEPMPMSDFVYTTFKQGDVYVAGMMPILPKMGKMRPHWGAYFTVNDDDGAAGAAVTMGATLCAPPTDIPGVGRFAGITSPQGVTFYVIGYSR